MATKEEIIKEYRDKLNNKQIVCNTKFCIVPYKKDIPILDEINAINLEDLYPYDYIEFECINGYWDVRQV